MKNKEKPMVLFLAMRSSQKRQYLSLADKLNISSKVINIGKLGLGNFISAFFWLFLNRKYFPSWVAYDIEKNRIKGVRVYLIGYWIKILFGMATVIRAIKKESVGLVVLRNGSSSVQEAVISYCQGFGIKICYLENGPLPLTVMVDFEGVNANSTIPKDKDFYLSLCVPNDFFGLTRKAAPRIPKKNIKKNEIELPEKYVFVPFQVPYDTQVLKNSSWIKGMPEFYHVLESALESLSEDYVLVVKEHPSSEISFPELHEKNNRILFSSNSTEDLILNSKLVVTINSSVGMEALMHKKPVINLGEALYSIEGLSRYVGSLSELKDAFERLDNFFVDEEVLRAFLWWMDNCYLIPGRLRELHKSGEGVRLFEQKINGIL